MTKKDHLNFDLDFLGESKGKEVKQQPKAKNAPHETLATPVSKHVERMPLYVIAGIIVFGIIIYIGVTDADRNSNSNYSSTDNSTYSNTQSSYGNYQSNDIETPDGSLLFSLPSDWEKTTGMNENAELQLKNGSDDLFALVFSEKQEDFSTQR
jgi:hypothetical protein